MSRRSRQLSDREKALWNTVARTVEPLPGKAIDGLDIPPPEAPLVLPPKKTATDPVRPAATAPTRSPLQPADPRRERLVGKGRIDINAVLDLHGMRQSEADAATSAFIGRAMARGHRVLLVITGKGSKDGEEGRGVLRKRFLSGIEMGLYGSAITSVRPAHQRHGGRGAFYIFLKAKKPLRQRRP